MAKETSVGVNSTEFFDPPAGHAYAFMEELCSEAIDYGYMTGTNNCLGYFDKDEVAETLDNFVQALNLTPAQRAEVWAWVESLPWEYGEIQLQFGW